jgi:hypothetical protein
VPMTPRSPLKSAMKVPGTPGRALQNPMSPTFLEEQVLEKREKMTEKEQARDLVSRRLGSLPALAWANTWDRKSRHGYGWPSSLCVG